MECQDDSCDLHHCKKCGCHTVGNTLGYGGYCDECDLEMDANSYQESNKLPSKIISDLSNAIHENIEKYGLSYAHLNLFISNYLLDNNLRITEKS
jgi:hypothetical protein